MIFESIFNGVLSNFFYDVFKKIFFKNSTDSAISSTEEIPMKLVNNETQDDNNLVPKNIEFSSILLETPNLEEIGIPKPLIHLPYIKRHVSEGDWVNRGDLLVTYHFSYYKSPKKLPLYLRIFIPDAMYKHHVFELHSPISGFVVDLRDVMCRDSSSGRSAYIGMIENNYDVLPTLLVPIDEPTWDDNDLQFFKIQVYNSLTNNWQSNLHNLGGGSYGYKRVRLSEAIEEYGLWEEPEQSKRELESAINWTKTVSCASREWNVTWKTVKYDDYRTSYNNKLDDRIEEFRAKDLIMRDKLLHLIKKSNK